MSDRDDGGQLQQSGSAQQRGSAQQDGRYSRGQVPKRLQSTNNPHVASHGRKQWGYGGRAGDGHTGSVRDADLSSDKRDKLHVHEFARKRKLDHFSPAQARHQLSSTQPRAQHDLRHQLSNANRNMDTIKAQDADEREVANGEAASAKPSVHERVMVSGQPPQRGIDVVDKAHGVHLSKHVGSSGPLNAEESNRLGAPTTSARERESFPSRKDDAKPSRDSFSAAEHCAQGTAVARNTRSSHSDDRARDTRAHEDLQRQRASLHEDRGSRSKSPSLYEGRFFRKRYKSISPDNFSPRYRRARSAKGEGHPGPDDSERNVPESPARDSDKRNELENRFAGSRGRPRSISPRVERNRKRASFAKPRLPPWFLDILQLTAPTREVYDDCMDLIDRYRLEEAIMDSGRRAAESMQRRVRSLFCGKARPRNQVLHDIEDIFFDSFTRSEIKWNRRDEQSGPQSRGRFSPRRTYSRDSSPHRFTEARGQNMRRRETGASCDFNDRDYDDRRRNQNSGRRDRDHSADRHSADRDRAAFSRYRDAAPNREPSSEHNQRWRIRQDAMGRDRKDNVSRTHRNAGNNSPRDQDFDGYSGMQPRWKPEREGEHSSTPGRPFSHGREGREHPRSFAERRLGKDATARQSQHSVGSRVPQGVSRNVSPFTPSPANEEPVSDAREAISAPKYSEERIVHDIRAIEQRLDSLKAKIESGNEEDEDDFGVNDVGPCIELFQRKHLPYPQVWKGTLTSNAGVGCRVRAVGYLVTPLDAEQDTTEARKMFESVPTFLDAELWTTMKNARGSVSRSDTLALFCPAGEASNTNDRRNATNFQALVEQLVMKERFAVASLAEGERLLYLMPPCDLTMAALDLPLDACELHCALLGTLVWPSEPVSVTQK